jgi:ribosomal-protein-alanine N-acetyltransferase
MFDRATDRMVGTSGLMEIHGSPEVELIYSLEPDYWGGGLATEASRGLLRFGFEEIGVDRIFAGTDLPNLNSLRVMERLGLVFFGRIRIGLVETVYYWMRPS